MNRIYKHYNFENVAASFIAAKRVSFSSYPGFLESLDDFYIMSNNLAMVQTTNSIYDKELYKKVHPQSLFAWQRVRLACQNAHDGLEWSKIIATHNSGTYNNQYMLVDYNKFEKGVAVHPGTLYVVEQIPGLVEYGDMTDQLERGYWASYNVPYFPKVYNESGYPEFVKKHGPSFSYQMAPRAEIFRRDAGTVTDMESFKAIMRYNDYKKDPYSHGNPGDAICSRFDLEPENPQPFGCYDTKVTYSDWIPLMKSQAINGPTQSHGIPAFSWKEQPAFNKTAHFGIPTVMDFDFITMEPLKL
jgi:Phospholipase B